MHLSEINIYPIKSLRGICLDSAKVEDRGLQYDRRWMLVDEKGKFLTQREVPRMARVQIELNGGLLARSDDMDPLELRMLPETEEVMTVQVFSSRLKALPYEDGVNEWFSQAIGLPCRLVTMGDWRRPVSYWYRVHKDDNVSFADGYPFLLIGEGSLEELNRRLDTPVPMDRFRPNLVIRGLEPFEEDNWKKVRIGSTVFHVVKPCGRCIIPTTDQSTGEREGGEPIKTLSTFRTVRRGGKNKVLFGQNLIAEEAGGTLKVGDQVEVVEYKKEITKLRGKVPFPSTVRRP